MEGGKNKLESTRISCPFENADERQEKSKSVLSKLNTYLVQKSEIRKLKIQQELRGYKPDSNTYVNKVKQQISDNVHGLPHCITLY